MRAPEQGALTVSSHDEWSLLEEVIVGRVDGACVPAWHPTLEATVPSRAIPWLKDMAGRPFPAELIEKAADELEGLCATLVAQGVTVTRPDPVDWSTAFETPDMHQPCGLYAAMPRDCLLVIGDELIEAPMAWPSRAFELRAYRPLLQAYFERGARWTSAPQPRRTPALYAPEHHAAGYDVQAGRSVVTEAEPVFDAADFARCGQDIFGQLSHVTNRQGVRWLARHLGPDYRVHLLDVDDPHAMHIDATFVPLAPGRVMVNPERLRRLPPCLADWEILTPPPPVGSSGPPLLFSSDWLSINVLSLDERRIVVEAQERPLIDFLRAAGFEPIPVPFRHFAVFGGGFHCATLDVRRRGERARHVRM